MTDAAGVGSSSAHSGRVDPRHRAESPCDLAVARAAIRAEIGGLESLAAGLDDAFAAAVDVCATATGRVIVTGLGKSGHVARKIAATLASTGTPAQFVHPVEASHGDLGMIGGGVPVEARVAAILRATWPLLPRPVTMTRPVAVRGHTSRGAKASSKPARGSWSPDLRRKIAAQRRRDRKDFPLDAQVNASGVRRTRPDPSRAGHRRPTRQANRSAQQKSRPTRCIRNTVLLRPPSRSSRTRCGRNSKHERASAMRPSRASIKSTGGARRLEIEHIRGGVAQLLGRQGLRSPIGTLPAASTPRTLSRSLHRSRRP